jgi:4-hydroxy-tetrahydrodipicolinate synthase
MRTPLPANFAALCTPIDDRGGLDLATFDRIVDFVMTGGAEGVVIGGATSEFPHFTVEQRGTLIRRAVERVAGRGPVLANIGTSSVLSTIELARAAADAGCAALLLPMPYFFRYTQEDLIAYCEAVCASVSAPFLLYNLSSFTTPIEIPTAIRLLEAIPNMIGMKDSSGNAAHLVPLAEACSPRGLTLFAGYDTLILDAMRAGWNGAISGVACFAPELVAAAIRSYSAGDDSKSAALQAQINELVAKVIAPLPSPWGIRLGLAARGIATGPLHLPISPARARQIDTIRAWLAEWTSSPAASLDGHAKNDAAS